MKNFNKKWTPKELNSYKRRCKLVKLLHIVGYFYCILIAIIIVLCIILSYVLLSNDSREVISFIFIPIISAVVVPLVVSYINRGKEAKLRRFENNKNIYFKLGEILLYCVLNEGFSEKKKMEFKRFIVENYNYMSMNFSSSMNADIYRTYLAYEFENKENVVFFAEQCISHMNDEKGEGPYFNYQSFMIEFLKESKDIVEYVEK